MPGRAGPELDRQLHRTRSRSTEYLKRSSGNQQIPLLIDAERGVMMPESDDIIEWLHEDVAVKAGA